MTIEGLAKATTPLSFYIRDSNSSYYEEKT